MSTRGCDIYTEPAGGIVAPWRVIVTVIHLAARPAHRTAAAPAHGGRRAGRETSAARLARRDAVDEHRRVHLGDALDAEALMHLGRA